MDIELASGGAEKLTTDLLVVGVFADGSLSPSAKAADTALQGRIAAVVTQGDLASAAGSTLTLFATAGTAARVMLVALGKRDDFSDRVYRQVLGAIGKALGASPAKTAAVTIAENAVSGRSLAWRLREAARVLADGTYRFVLPGDKPKPAAGVAKATLLVPDALTAELREAVRQGLAIAEGMALTRDLGNLPGNICNPAYLAETAKALGKEFSFAVEVLEREDMAKLGMGSFLSVGRASANPCKFIVLHYKGGKADQKPVVLVGKGITFDTGGVSLKPGANLDEMKFDMSGSGSVLGVIKTAARLALPINVIGVVTAAENMPGGDASRPGDIVRTMSGLTIEILNTDAEGRLLLCDALTYAERFSPACVVDIATLTGACVIALGAHASGLYANNDALADELLQAGGNSGDRAWRMPLWDDYMSQLKSNFADMSNLGGAPAGSVTAAVFLGRFTQAYPWAHLDIAGTASVSGDAKGSTGRPVPLLADFLLSRASAAH